MFGCVWRASSQFSAPSLSRSSSADLASATQQLDEATSRARKAEAVASSLQQQLGAETAALQASRTAEQRAAGDLLALKKLVDEQASDQQRTAELAKMREAEIEDLRFQLSKTSSELVMAQRESAKKAEQLQMDLASVRGENQSAQATKQELERKVTSQASTIGRLEARTDELERAQQAHDLEFELLRTKTAEQLLQEREKWEKQLREARAHFEVLEDAAVQAKRDRDAALRDVEAYKALLESEQETVRARVADKAKLEAQVDQQHLVLADLDKINGDLRAELASTKARLVVAEEKAGRTVVSDGFFPLPVCDSLTFGPQVEHIRVLEEAQRCAPSQERQRITVLTTTVSQAAKPRDGPHARRSRQARRLRPYARASSHRSDPVSRGRKCRLRSSFAFSLLTFSSSSSSTSARRNDVLPSQIGRRRTRLLSASTTLWRARRRFVSWPN